MTKTTELGLRIADRVRTDGPITFRDYMEMALYEPELGYYTRGRNPIGRGGDFYTSPTSTPLFGQMLARWLGQRYRELGAETCTVVELGAARGVLAKHIKAALPNELPAGCQNVDYRQIDFADPVPVLDIACVISNELVDAFPVHRVRLTEQGLREIYVEVKEDRFIEILRPPSTPRLESYLADLGVVLPADYATEINLAAVDWIRAIANNLTGGYVLTIDYGYESGELYAPYRAAGTLIGYHRHQYSENPYDLIGDQDLTSHVNFSALTHYGEAAGLETVEFTTQADFLTRLDALKMLEALQKQSIGDVAALKNYLALKDLLLPDGMGGVFKVLVQRKA